MKRVSKVFGKLPIVGAFASSIILNPIFSGSAVMMFGSNLANFFAYLFHLVIGRILGTEKFAEVSSIISFLGLVSVTYTSLGLAIVKFASTNTNKQNRIFYYWARNRSIFLGLAFGVVILFLSPLFSNFLRVDVLSVTLTAPIVFFSLIGFLNRSFLQGLLKFKEQVITLNVELVVRLISALVLVFLGFSVFGAIGGILISVIVGWLATFPFLPKYLRGKKLANFKNQKDIIFYGIPVLIQAAAMTSFISTDVILVKHYFAPHSAGLYAAAANLAKIIFFGTGPVGAVMFPIIARKFARKEGYKRVLFYSFMITSVIAFGVLAIYFIFPKFAIEILYGDEFIGAAPLIGLFGLSMSVFTLSGLLGSFFFSIGRTKTVIFLATASAMQVVGILFFHDSLDSVIKVSVFCAIFLLVAYLSYFIYGIRRNSIL